MTTLVALGQGGAIDFETPTELVRSFDVLRRSPVVHRAAYASLNLLRLEDATPLTENGESLDELDELMSAVVRAHFATMAINAIPWLACAFFVPIFIHEVEVSTRSAKKYKQVHKERAQDDVEMMAPFVPEFDSTIVRLMKDEYGQVKPEVVLRAKPKTKMHIWRGATGDPKDAPCSRLIERLNALEVITLMERASIVSAVVPPTYFEKVVTKEEATEKALSALTAEGTHEKNPLKSYLVAPYGAVEEIPIIESAVPIGEIREKLFQGLTPDPIVSAKFVPPGWRVASTQPRPVQMLDASHHRREFERDTASSFALPLSAVSDQSAAQHRSHMEERVKMRNAATRQGRVLESLMSFAAKVIYDADVTFHIPVVNVVDVVDVFEAADRGWFTPEGAVVEYAQTTGVSQNSLRRAPPPDVRLLQEGAPAPPRKKAKRKVEVE